MPFNEVGLLFDVVDPVHVQLVDSCLQLRTSYRLYSEHTVMYLVRQLCIATSVRQ